MTYEWKKSSEELPPKDHRVLMFSPQWGGTHIAKLMVGINRQKIVDGKFLEYSLQWELDDSVETQFQLEEVSHWCELPEPPKE